MDQAILEPFLSVCLGLGLAAAAGFRVFVPPLVASLAARADWVELGGGFDWMASDAALAAFAVATGLEVLAYYVPWVDNLLDTVATPTAVVAGILVSGALFTDMHPLLRWSLAIFAGGTVATSVQALTVAARAASSLGTGGLGNPVVSTLETVGSAALSALAVLVPVLAALIATTLLAFAVRKVFLRRTPRRLQTEPPAS